MRRARYRRVFRHCRGKGDWQKCQRNSQKNLHKEQESQLRSPVREVSPAGELQPLGRNTAAHASDQGEGCIRSEFAH